MNMMSVARAGATAFLLSLLPQSAHAQPYELVAKLQQGDGDTKRVVEIVVTEGAMIPRDLPDVTLLGFDARFKTDDVSKAARADLRNLVVSTTFPEGGPADVRKSIPADAKEPERVFSLADIPARGPVTRVAVETRAKLSVQFLCAKEMELRRATSKPDQIEAAEAELLRDFFPVEVDPKAPPPKAAAGKKVEPKPRVLTPEQKRAVGLLALYPLRGKDKRLIAYSHCPDGAAVDWLEATGVSTRADADGLRERHQAALAEMLDDKLDAELGANVRFEADAPGMPKNHFVTSTLHFGVANALGGRMSLLPISAAAERAKEAITIDQAAVLRIDLEDELCTQLLVGCAELVKRHLVVSIKGKDQNGADVDRRPKLDYRGGEVFVAADLREFLNQQIVVTVHYQHAGTLLRVHERRVDVKNLGITMSFPVVTEAVQLIEGSQQAGWSPKDIEYQSSLPISWAYNANAGDGQRVAITLPFMVGYNPEAVPNLSDYIRAYVHVSAVLPTSGTAEGGTTAGDATAQGEPQLALGAGVSLLRAFAFGWGVAADTGANYLMVGLSMPDLAKLGAF